MQRVIYLEFRKISFIVLFYWIFIFNIKSSESKMEEPPEIKCQQFHPEKITENRSIENTPSTATDATNKAFSKGSLGGRRFLKSRTLSSIKEARKACELFDMKLFCPDSWESVIEFVEEIKQWWTLVECMPSSVEIWTDLHVYLTDLIEDPTKYWLYRAFYFPDLQKKEKRKSSWETFFQGYLTIKFSYNSDEIVIRFVPHSKKLPYICVEKVEVPPSSTMIVNATLSTARATTPVDMPNNTAFSTAKTSPVDPTNPTASTTTDLDKSTEIDTPTASTTTAPDTSTAITTTAPDTSTETDTSTAITTTAPDTSTETDTPTAITTTTPDTSTETYTPTAITTTAPDTSTETDTPTAITTTAPNTSTETYTPTAITTTAPDTSTETDTPTAITTTTPDTSTGSDTPIASTKTAPDTSTAITTTAPDTSTETDTPTAITTTIPDTSTETDTPTAITTTAPDTSMETDTPTASTTIVLDTPIASTAAPDTSVETDTSTSSTATAPDKSTGTDTTIASTTASDMSADTPIPTVNTTTAPDTSTETGTPTASTMDTTDSDNDECCEGQTYFHSNYTIIFKDTDFGSTAVAYPCPKGSYGYATWKCSNTTRNFTGDPKVFCQEIDCSIPPKQLGPPKWEDGGDKIPRVQTQRGPPTSDKKQRLDEFGTVHIKSYMAERLRKCGDVGKDKVFERMKNNRLDLKGKRPREMRQGMDNVLGMYNRIVDEDSAMWKNMSEEESRDTSMELIKETEATAWVLGCEDDNEVAMKKDNIAIEIFQLRQKQGYQKLNISLTSKGIGTVSMPGNLNVTQNTQCKRPVQKGILAGYKNIESYLSPNSSMKITSGIIGVSLGDFNVSQRLPGNKTIRIKLRHPPASSDRTRVCVFLNWNYTESNSTYGVWDTKGCIVSKAGEEFTECECNHLTNFAILMDFAGPEFKVKDDLLLKLLSLICCGISSVALLLTVIIYITVRSLRSRRNTITCNLAACLLAMNILVQTGLNRVEKTICQIVSAVLQYSVLPAFFWMLLEGILLYRMVITVFKTKNVRSFILYIIAYGIPFVIVVLCSAMYPAEMIREKYCWPAKEKGLIWSVLGPVVLVIVVNLIIFCLTMNAAARIDKMNSTNTSFGSKKKTLVQRSKGMMSLTCLLGFTWAIGFFYVPMKEVAAYIFVILNGLQGFFLFLTQMIFNDPVRNKLLAIYKENFTWLSSKTSSFSVVNAKIGLNARNNPKQADDKKLKPSKSDLSIMCPPSEEDPPSAPPPPYEGLQVRLNVFEDIQQTDVPYHPFGVNTEPNLSLGYLTPIVRLQ